MIIAVASGKGGTGKTTVAAGLADLAAAERRLVLADADVDAANLELLLAPSLLETHEFVAGEVAAIDAQACICCGRCAEACRFDAIGRDPAGGAYRIDPGACEGCAACYYVCPEAAVVLSDRHSGRWFASQTRYGPLLHAHLFAGQENSGKLVTRLRQEAMVRANESGADLVVVDGPPGIGCPVIAAVSGVDLALMVTEPSVSGLHDLERILGVAQHFRVPAVVVVNKADLNPARTREVESFCASRGIPVIGRLPYDAAVITWLTRGEPITSEPEGPVARAVRAVWQALSETLFAGT